MITRAVFTSPASCACAKLVEWVENARTVLAVVLGLSLIANLACAQENSSARATVQPPIHSDNASKPVLPGGSNDVGRLLDNGETPPEPAFVFPGLDQSLQPWFDFKERLNKDYGFRLGTDYQFVLQGATESLGENHAAGGAFRLFFDWTLTGRGTTTPGTLVFKTENRHRLGTDVSPEAFAGELGYVGITGTGYGDFGWGVTDLYWKQRLFLGGRLAELRVGRLAPTAYFDGTLTSDPYTTFLNFSLNFTPTIAYPSDGSLGAMLWASLSDNIYALFTVLDANSSTTKFGFDTFRSGELFKGLEVGWANRGAENSLVDNVHIAMWHSDDRPEAGVAESWGVGITASGLFGDDGAGLTVRTGMSEGGAAMMKRSLSVGYAINLTSRNDLLGLGASWGKPFAAPDVEQVAAEVFYRFQLARNLAVTADVQYIDNPALSPARASTWVFGLRTRITF